MNILSKAIKTVVKSILYRMPLKYIIFESIPDFSGNPWQLYLEFLKHGVDKKYKCIWFVHEEVCVPKEVSHIFKRRINKKAIFHEIRHIYILGRAKLILDSNVFVKKINPKSVRIFTRHGATLKKNDIYIKSTGLVDFMLTTSEQFADVEFDIFYPEVLFNRSQLVVLGFPNNDTLFKSVNLYTNGFWAEILNKEVSTIKQFHKIIGWLPTYRQHRNNDPRISLAKQYLFGIPLIHNHEDLIELNRYLIQENVLLVVQLHHAQKWMFPKVRLSNIVQIEQKTMSYFRVSVTNLMHNLDALISDYSTIYYEFLMLNRPIALAVDDFEEYSSKIGFDIDYKEWIKGVYLTKFSELLMFVKDVSQNRDTCFGARQEALCRAHKYIDDESTMRVSNFIYDYCKL